MITGEYYNIFGITKLDADLSDAVSSKEEKNVAFLHERIHYIQNFSTVYGVNRALLKMSQYLGTILQIQEGKFPSKPFEREDQEFIGAIFEMAEGDSFDNEGNIVQCHAVQKIEEIDNYTFFGYDVEFPEYRYLYKNQLALKYDDGKEYYFGGSAISESMSYLFEQIFFNEVEYSHRLPYDACNLVYKYLVKTECKCTVLVALCYSSLMSMWPGNTFVDLCKCIKENNIELNSAKEVFNFAKEKMQEVPTQIIDEILKKLDLIFPEEKEFPAKVFEEESNYAREWLKTKYKFLIEREEEFREALVWILDEVEDDKKLALMSCLLDEYGQPIIIDSKGKMYSGEDKKLVHALAPLSLYKIVIERNPTCFMNEICISNNGIPDEDCKKWCWKHKSSNGFCILRYYLYKMGLGAIEFEKLENTPFVYEK